VIQNQILGLLFLIKNNPYAKSSTPDKIRIQIDPPTDKYAGHGDKA
jgi:hypothetical protein